MTNDFFRVSTPKQEPIITQRYTKLGLKDNPFPEVAVIQVGNPDQRTNGTIYESKIRAKEQANFDSIFVPHSDKPRKRLAFIMDNATHRGRSTGKSAFLYHQCKRTESDWGKKVTNGAYVLFASYIQPQAQTRKFWEFSKLIATTLNEQEIIAKAIWRIRYLYGGLPTDILSQVDDPKKTIGNDEWLKTYNIDLSYKMRNVLVTEGRLDADSAVQLGFFGNDASKLEETFFSHTDDTYWRKHGNEFTFNTLVKLFRLAQIDYGLLLIDEVEKIVSYQNKSERREFADSLRYFIFDGNCESARSSFYSILLTIHPYVQELLLPHWESSGIDRFAALSKELAENYTIYFRPIEKELAEDLVKVYLDHYRLEDSGNCDKLFPFDQEAIMEAMVYTKGVPGPFLTFLHNLVEFATNEKYDNISRKSVTYFVESSKAPKPSDFEEDEKIMLPKSSVDLLGRGLS